MMWKLTVVYLAMTVLAFFCIGCGVVSCIQVINDNGGIKQITIEAGKDLKDIQRQINEEQPNDK